ncbi:MAG: flagellar protein FlgN [Nitrospirales bacterium]|nr:flagellar protein FlgN [Nitrospira sp.]MDR4502336.1 flagellar protein FlgN [Nitrospirales bacterium]
MNTEKPWGELQRLFQEECAAYRRLADVLEEEWTLLKRLDHARLHDISDRKEDILKHIEGLERSRTHCVQLLHPIDSSKQSLEWVVHTQVPESIPVKRILRQLISIGKRVKQLSDQNSRLISRGLHIVREAMQVVHEGLGYQPMYGETGGLRFPGRPTSLDIKG